jgi:alanyl-tRNA synthetase
MGVERLYYTDSYLREFSARIVARDGVRVYLDRTAFYPASGGQPFDTGFIGGAAVTEVIDEADQIAHVTAAPPADGDVRCTIDWPRRFDHMQQHSGQHLLSAVFAEMYGYQTVSVHLGRDSSTVDLDVPAIPPDRVAAAEQWANQTVFENRVITASIEENPADLRKASSREGLVRVVTIRDLDRSACGGTHVRATGEIGPVLIRRLEKIRNSLRVEFLCGMRAVRRAREDYDGLNRVAQIFSATLEDAPGLVASQREALEAAEKARRKLQEDVFRYRAKELYDATTPRAEGVRHTLQRAGARMDDLRLLAQNFTAYSRAVFAGVVEEPPSVLLASSADSGVEAGKMLKEILAAAGGRGGGSSRLAQGSVPDRAALERAVLALQRLLSA